MDKKYFFCPTVTHAKNVWGENAIVAIVTFCNT